LTEELSARNAALDRDYYETEAVWYVPTTRQVLCYAFEKAPRAFRIYLEECDPETTTVAALLERFAEGEREDIADFFGEV